MLVTYFTNFRSWVNILYASFTNFGDINNYLYSRIKYVAIIREDMGHVGFFIISPCLTSSFGIVCFFLGAYAHIYRHTK